MAAARAGRLDLVKRLVVAGADVHWKSPEGANAASVVFPSSSWQAGCAATPARAAVAAWLAERKVVIDPASRDSEIKLFYAAWDLLNAGANVHAADDCQCQPIHSAMNLDMIQLLIQAGADVNSKAGTGEWPLKEAAAGRGKSFLQILVCPVVCCQG